MRLLNPCPHTDWFHISSIRLRTDLSSSASGMNSTSTDRIEYAYQSEALAHILGPNIEVS